MNNSKGEGCVNVCSSAVSLFTGKVATIDHSLSARSITNTATNQKAWKMLRAHIEVSTSNEATKITMRVSYREKL